MEILVAIVAIIGMVVATGAVTVALVVFRGYVLSVLWHWFMVPILHLPVLSVPQAIGIALVVGFLTKQSTDGLAKEKREGWKKYCLPYVEIIGYPLIALLIGWVVHQYM